MSNKLYEENDIQNIANAIRNKNGTEDTYKVSQMSTAIDSIQSSNIIGATAEGESLNLANTKAMPYSDYAVEGKSEQDGEPSPSNPSEIHSVADDLNLYDIENANVSNLGSNITVTKKNDTVKMVCNGTVYGAILGNVTLGKVQEYTIACDVEGGVETQLQWGLRVKFQDNTYSNVSNSNKLTFTTKQKNEQIQLMFYVRVGQDFTGTVILSNIKLQEGTTATPYSPYNQGTVTIKQRGKNLVNVTATSKTTGGITFTVNSDKSIKLNGTNTSGGTLFYRLSDNFTLPAGTYTLSNHNDNCNPSSTYGFYDDGNNFDRTKTSTKTFSGTVTIKPYIKIDAGISINNQIIYPMIEQNSTATDYEPYQGNDYTFQTEPLRSLPNGVKDTIEADGIHRRVGRIVLDGTEYCANYVNSTYAFAVFLPVGIPDIKHLASVDRVLCSHLQHTILNNIYSKRETQDNNLISTQGTRSFAIMINNYTSTTELQTYLAQQYANGTPVIIQYELAEEIIEPLTQNQATTMLDIIKTGSYEGTTNIYTDEDVKPTIGVGYYKKG